jgi:hypothetical protein
MVRAWQSCCKRYGLLMGYFSCIDARSHRELPRVLSSAFIAQRELVSAALGADAGRLGASAN